MSGSSCENVPVSGLDYGLRSHQNLQAHEQTL